LYLRVFRLEHSYYVRVHGIRGVKNGNSLIIPNITAEENGYLRVCRCTETAFKSYRRGNGVGNFRYLRLGKTCAGGKHNKKHKRERCQQGFYFSHDFAPSTVCVRI